MPALQCKACTGACPKPRLILTWDAHKPADCGSKVNIGRTMVSTASQRSTSYHRALQHATSQHATPQPCTEQHSISPCRIAQHSTLCQNPAQSSSILHSQIHHIPSTTSRCKAKDRTTKAHALLKCHILLPPPSRPLDTYDA